MPLSQKQMEYLALAWQCFDTEPKIDYEKFKDVAGLASAHSARELMRITKNKLKSEYGALSGDVRAANKAGTPGGGVGRKAVSSATPGSGGTGKGRKRAKAAADEGDADGECDASPAAKKKTRLNQAKVVQVKKENSTDGLEETGGEDDVGPAGEGMFGFADLEFD